jgi:hypothetical protein
MILQMKLKTQKQFVIWYKFAVAFIFIGLLFASNDGIADGVSKSSISTPTIKFITLPKKIVFGIENTLTVRVNPNDLSSSLSIFDADDFKPQRVGDEGFHSYLKSSDVSKGEYTYGFNPDKRSEATTTSLYIPAGVITNNKGKSNQRVEVTLPIDLRSNYEIYGKHIIVANGTVTIRVQFNKKIKTISAADFIVSNARIENTKKDTYTSCEEVVNDQCVKFSYSFTVFILTIVADGVGDVSVRLKDDNNIRTIDGYDIYPSSGHSSKTIKLVSLNANAPTVQLLGLENGVEYNKETTAILQFSTAVKITDSEINEVNGYAYISSWSSNYYYSTISLKVRGYGQQGKLKITIPAGNFQDKAGNYSAPLTTEIEIKNQPKISYLSIYNRNDESNSEHTSFWLGLPSTKSYSDIASVQLLTPNPQISYMMNLSGFQYGTWTSYNPADGNTYLYHNDTGIFQRISNAIDNTTYTALVTFKDNSTASISRFLGEANPIPIPATPTITVTPEGYQFTWDEIQSDNRKFYYRISWYDSRYTGQGYHSGGSDFESTTSVFIPYSAFTKDSAVDLDYVEVRVQVRDGVGSGVNRSRSKAIPLNKNLKRNIKGLNAYHRKQADGKIYSNFWLSVNGKQSLSVISSIKLIPEGSPTSYNISLDNFEAGISTSYDSNNRAATLYNDADFFARFSSGTLASNTTYTALITFTNNTTTSVSSYLGTYQAFATPGTPTITKKQDGYQITWDRVESDNNELYYRVSWYDSRYPWDDYHVGASYRQSSTSLFIPNSAFTKDSAVDLHHLKIRIEAYDKSCNYENRYSGKRIRLIPLDTLPDAFNYQTKVNVPLNSWVHASKAATIKGINSTVRVTITNGDFKVYHSKFFYWINSGWIGEGEEYIMTEGERIIVRHISTNTFGAYTTTTLTVGDYTTNFVSKTRIADSNPDSFSFASRSNVPINYNIESDTIRLRGFEGEVDISVQNGEYRLNGGTWQPNTGKATLGDILQIRIKSPIAFATKKTMQVSIGSITASFAVTTIGKDSTIEPINFATISDAPTGTRMVSNPARIRGINTNLAVSIAGNSNNAKYSINNGNFVNTAGSINNGDTIQLRLTSADSLSSTRTATLTIGSQSFNFSVITQAKDTSGDSSDTRAPALQVPEALTIKVSIDSTGVSNTDNRIVRFLNSAYAVDDKDGIVTVTNNAPEIFPLGKTVVRFSAEDTAGNKSERSVSVDIQLPPDTEAPLFTGTLPEINLKASGIFTPISKLRLSTVTATDNRDGTIIAKHNLFYPLLSGKHRIVWTATDKAGNKTQASQEVNIYPQANLLLDQYAGKKTPVSVRAFLTGPAPDYPVVIPLKIDYHSSLLSANITIGSSKIGKRQRGLLGEYRFKMTKPDTGNFIQFTMQNDGLSNAHKGKKTSMKVHYVETQVSPIGQIIITQEGFQTSIVDIASSFTLSAEVFDPNSDDTHTYQWEYKKIGQSAQTADTQTVQIDFSTESGKDFMWIKLKVTDSQGLSSENSRMLRLIDSRIMTALSASTDSDGDGISDQKEGIKDSDGDGILDYEDDDERAHFLPTSKTIIVADAEGSTQHRTVSMQAKEGQKIRLGATSIRAGRKNANIDLALLKQFGSQGEEASKAEDIGNYEFKGDAIDFEVTGLSQAGESIQVVVPLNNPLVKGAVYRKFSADQGWKDFIINAKNSIESAPSDQGICPDIDASNSWKAGLTEGYDCLRLTIEDGGPNDGDGQVNAKVADPGAIFTEKSADDDDDNSNQVGEDSSGGCALIKDANQSFSPTFILLLAISSLMIIYRNRRRKNQ